MEPRVKALILDRDGTLIVHVPYLCDPMAVELLPGVRDGLRIALAKDTKLFLHSNQSGVGRGLFTMEAVEACNHRMIELLDLGPAPFTGVCIAPERPGEPSRYRKPSPAFAREVAAEYGLLPDEICYVGDRGSDLESADQAGVQAVGVSTGLDSLEADIDPAKLTRSYPIFASFDAAIQHLFNVRSPSLP